MADTDDADAEPHPDDALSTLAALGQATDRTALVTLYTRDETGEHAPHRLNPTESLAEDFLGTVQKVAQGLAEKSPIKYDPGRPHKERDQIAWTPAQEVPTVSRIERDVANYADVMLLDPEGTSLKALKFYVVSVQAEVGEWVHFIRKMSPKQRLARSGKLAAFWTRATFDRLESDVLLFDDSFDAVVSDGVVLIDNQHVFQLAVGFLGPLSQVAANTVSHITTNLRIRNLDGLLEAVETDVTMMNKARSIAEKLENHPEYADAMAMGPLIAFIRSRPWLHVDIQGAEGQEEIVFHPGRRRWEILRLLDDDYLTSELTSQEYEANSKAPVD